METFIHKFILLVVLTTPTLADFFCPLTWTEVTYGDSLEACVSINPTSHVCLVRKNCDSESNYAYNITAAKLEDHQSLPILCKTKSPFFDVLMNSNACKVSWESHFTAKEMYLVKENEVFIGRNYESTWQPVVAHADHLKTLPFIQYLASSSPGFHIVISDKKYTHPPFTPTALDLDFELIGHDSFDNETPVEYSHQIVHKKEVMQTITDTLVDIKYSGEIHSLATDDYPTIDTDTDYRGTKNSSTHTDTVSSMVETSTTRTIVIPGYSKIEVCTVISMTNNTSPYSATGTFYLPGHSGNEIEKLFYLKKIPFEIIAVEESSVKVKMSGVRNEKFILESKVIITASNITCPAIRSAASAWDAYRRGEDVPNIEFYLTTLRAHFNV